MSEDCKDSCRATENVQRGVLAKVLGINLAQSLIGGSVGLWAASTAVMGAAIDNLADAGVYAISLYAVGRSAAHKVRVARISGWLLLLLSAYLGVEVIRRFLGSAAPIGFAMMVMASVNVGLNLICLRLLRSQKDQGANFKASWIFTNNDTLVNLGIVLSGALVLAFQSSIPDLIVGSVVVVIAFRSGLEVLEEARGSTSEPAPPR
ncbi:MAG: cation transporter [Nevskiaceae bacterium]|nr:MAG: cation transporter [Nevskiaceae bacterium]